MKMFKSWINLIQSVCTPDRVAFFIHLFWKQCQQDSGNVYGFNNHFDMVALVSDR